MLATLLALIAIDIAGYQRPGPGELLIKGNLTKVSGKVLTIDIEMVVDPKGIELNLATPSPQKVSTDTSTEVLTFDRSAAGLLKQLKPGPIEARVAGLALGKDALLAKRLCGTLETRAAVLPSRSGTRKNSRLIEPDGVCREPVSVSLVFPVLGVKVPSDTWLADRDGGARRHLGQDIMGAKMLPLVACFDGTIYTSSRGTGGHNRLTIVSDTGWTAEYMHVNNDTIGTNDGLGGLDLAFAPGIVSGARVRAGQLVGWNGNSGNAESVGPHCHFELWQDGACFNAHPSLVASQRIKEPKLYLPAYDQRPEKGEVRIDGAVRSYDPSRRILIIGVLAERKAGGQVEAETQPRARYLDLSGTKFRSINGAELSVVTSFKRGDAIVAFGPEAADGKALAVRSLLVPLDDQPVVSPPPVEPIVDPGPVTTVQTAPPTVLNLLRSDIAQPVLDGINAYRKRYNAPPLFMHKSLGILAQTHSQDMAAGDFLTELADPITKARAVGFKGGQAVCLIAGEDEDGWKAVHRWLRDAKARDAMLSPAFSTIGVGFVELANDEGNVRVGRYWTIILGAP